MPQTLHLDSPNENRALLAATWTFPWASITPVAWKKHKGKHYNWKFSISLQLFSVHISVYFTCSGALVLDRSLLITASKSVWLIPKSFAHLLRSGRTFSFMSLFKTAYTKRNERERLKYFRRNYNTHIRSREVNGEDYCNY